MAISIEELPDLRVVAMRHVGPYPQIGAKFGAINAWAKENAVPGTIGIAIYHDSPADTPPEALRSDACLLVPPEAELVATELVEDPKNGDIHVFTIRGGAFAKHTHLGSYSKLGEAWQEFLQVELPQLNIPPTDRCLEIYVNDCGKVTEDELQTDIYLSLD